MPDASELARQIRTANYLPFAFSAAFVGASGGAASNSESMSVAAVTTQHILLLFEALQHSQSPPIQRVCGEALVQVFWQLPERSAHASVVDAGRQMRRQLGDTVFTQIFAVAQRMVQSTALVEPALELALRLMAMGDETFRLTHTPPLVDTVVAFVRGASAPHRATALYSLCRLVDQFSPTMLADDAFYQRLTTSLFALLRPEELAKVQQQPRAAQLLLELFSQLARRKPALLDHPFFEQVVQGGKAVRPLGRLLIQLEASMASDHSQPSGRALRNVRQFVRSVVAEEGQLGAAYCTAFPALLRIRVPPDEHAQRIVAMCLARDVEVPRAARRALCRWMRALCDGADAVDALQRTVVWTLLELRDELMTVSTRLSVGDGRRFVRCATVVLEQFYRLRDASADLREAPRLFDEFVRDARPTVEAIALLFVCYEVSPLSDEALHLLGLLARLSAPTPSPNSLYAVFAGRPINTAIRTARTVLRDCMRDEVDARAVAARFAWQQAFRCASRVGDATLGDQLVANVDGIDLQSQVLLPPMSPSGSGAPASSTASASGAGGGASGARRTQSIAASKSSKVTAVAREASSLGETDTHADVHEDDTALVFDAVWSAQWRFLTVTARGVAEDEEFVARSVRCMFASDRSVRDTLKQCVTMAPVPLLQKLTVEFEGRLSRHSQVFSPAANAADDDDVRMHIAEAARAQLACSIDVDFYDALSQALDRAVWADARLTLVRRAFAAAVQRWSSWPSSGTLNVLDVRTREQLAAVCYRFIELQCDPPSLVASVASRDAPLSPRSIDVRTQIASSTESQLRAILEAMYMQAVAQILQPRPATTTGGVDARIVKPAPPPKAAKKRLKLTLRSGDADVPPSAPPPTAAAASAAASSLALSSGDGAATAAASTAASSSTTATGAGDDANDSRVALRSLLVSVGMSYVQLLRCASMKLPATRQEVLEFIEVALASCPAEYRELCAEPMLSMFVTRQPEYFDTVLKKSFGIDLTSLSYMRALSYTLQLDFDNWMRRLGDPARFLHLTLYHQTSLDTRARSAASTLARLLSTGESDTANSALPLPIRELLRSARPRTAASQPALLQTQFLLPDLGALSAELAEFETLRWSAAVAAQHCEMTPTLFQHAWDLSGMVHEHRERFLHALGPWSRNFELLVAQSLLASNGAELHVDIGRGLRRLNDRTGPMVLLDCLSKMCSIFGPRTEEAANGQTSLLGALVQLWLELVPRTKASLQPRDDNGALMPNLTARSVDIVLEYLLLPRHDHLAVLAKRFVRGLAQRDSGLHSRTLVAWLAARIEVQPDESSGHEWQLFDDDVANNDDESVSEATAARAFSRLLQMLKHGRRRTVGESGVQLGASRLAVGANASDDDNNAAATAAAATSNSAAATAAPASAQAIAAEQRRRAALDLMLAIDFAPSASHSNQQSVARSLNHAVARTAAFVDALLPHLPVLFDAIFFDHVYMSKVGVVGGGAAGATALTVDCARAPVETLQDTLRSAMTTAGGAPTKKRFSIGKTSAPPVQKQRSPSGGDEQELIKPRATEHSDVAHFLQTLLLHCRPAHAALPASTMTTIDIYSLSVVVSSRLPSLRDDWARVALRRAMQTTEPKAVAAALRVFSELRVQTLSLSMVIGALALLWSAAGRGDGDQVRQLCLILADAATRGAVRQMASANLLARGAVALLAASDAETFAAALRLCQSLVAAGHSDAVRAAVRSGARAPPRARPEARPSTARTMWRLSQTPFKHNSAAASFIELNASSQTIGSGSTSSGHLHAGLESADTYRGALLLLKSASVDDRLSLANELLSHAGRVWIYLGSAPSGASATSGGVRPPSSGGNSGQQRDSSDSDGGADDRLPVPLFLADYAGTSMASEAERFVVFFARFRERKSAAAASATAFLVSFFSEYAALVQTDTGTTEAAKSAASQLTEADTVDLMLFAMLAALADAGLSRTNALRVQCAMIESFLAQVKKPRELPIGRLVPALIDAHTHAGDSPTVQAAASRVLELLRAVDRSRSAGPALGALCLTDAFLSEMRVILTPPTSAVAVHRVRRNSSARSMDERSGWQALSRAFATAVAQCEQRSDSALHDSARRGSGERCEVCNRTFLTASRRETHQCAANGSAKRPSAATASTTRSSTASDRSTAAPIYPERLMQLPAPLLETATRAAEAMAAELEADAVAGSSGARDADASSESSLDLPPSNVAPTVDGGDAIGAILMSIDEAGDDAAAASASDSATAPLPTTHGDGSASDDDNTDDVTEEDEDDDESSTVEDEDHPTPQSDSSQQPQQQPQQQQQEQSKPPAESVSSPALLTVPTTESRSTSEESLVVPTAAAATSATTNKSPRVKHQRSKSSDTLETPTSADDARKRKPRKHKAKQIVVARTDFFAEEADELTFRRGDRIEVLRQGDARGWWYGRVEGKKHRGFYPSLYTESVASKMTKRRSRVRSSNNDVVRAGNTQQRAAASAGTTAAAAASSGGATTAAASLVRSFLLAKWPYVAQDDDELTFAKGDVIAVVQEGEADGWWVGALYADIYANGENARLALVPVNYFGVCDDETARAALVLAASAQQAAARAAASSPVAVVAVPSSPSPATTPSDDELAKLQRQHKHAVSAVDGLRRLLSFLPPTEKTSRKNAQKELRAAERTEAALMEQIEQLTKSSGGGAM
jgi:hypothetical protein